MRETTWRSLAFCASVSPKRVSPRIAPLTSPSARSSALKSGEGIMGGNGMTFTSSRVFSTSNPPAPMLMGQGWRPGFGRPFYPELNVDKKVLRNLRMHLEALDDGAGPDDGGPNTAKLYGI